MNIVCVIKSARNLSRKKKRHAGREDHDLFRSVSEPYGGRNVESPCYNCKPVITRLAHRFISRLVLTTGVFVCSVIHCVVVILVLFYGLVGCCGILSYMECDFVLLLESIYVLHCDDVIYAFP